MMSMGNAMDFFGDGSILYHVIQYKENRPAISLCINVKMKCKIGEKRIRLMTLSIWYWQSEIVPYKTKTKIFHTIFRKSKKKIRIRYLKNR